VLSVFCTFVKPSFQDGVFTARYHGGTCGTPPRCVYITVLTVSAVVSPNHLQKVKKTVLLILRRLMSYIYMEHPFLMFLDHTQRRSTVGRTPLDE